MSDYAVWLDSEKAMIFEVTQSDVIKTHFEKTIQNHHTHNKKDHHGDSDTEHFYRDLALKLKGAERLLLLGPGLAKSHFKNHLGTHHTGDLAGRIVGIETVDHPTDNQILATARQFFESEPGVSP